VTGRGTAIGLLVCVPGYCPVLTETMQATSWQQHDVFAFQGRPYLQQNDRDGIFCIKNTSSRITREFWYRVFYLPDKSLTDIVRHVKLFRSRDSVVGIVTMSGVLFPGRTTYFCLFLNFQTAFGAPSSFYRGLMLCTELTAHLQVPKVILHGAIAPVAPYFFTNWYLP